MAKLTLDQIKAPENYFLLSDDEKKDVCMGLLETIYEIIIKTKGNNVSKLELLESILDSTLKYNEELEEFEHCQVLYDTKRLLDEQKGK
jgi:hypothetical protein